jgi:hypothetical protein
MLVHPTSLLSFAVIIVIGTTLPVPASAQPMPRSLLVQPSCVDTCIRSNKGCKECVKELTKRLSTPVRSLSRFSSLQSRYGSRFDGGACVLRIAVRQHASPSPPRTPLGWWRQSQPVAAFISRPLPLSLLQTTIHLPFHKAHPGLHDPKIQLDHHDFVDRPPWKAGSVLPPGHGELIRAEGKTHQNCPAMKARSNVGGITLYGARFSIGFCTRGCHWFQRLLI